MPVSDGRGTFEDFDQDDPHWQKGWEAEEPEGVEEDPEVAWPVVPDPAGGDHRAHRSRGDRRRAHPVLTGLALFVVILLVIVGAGLVWANSQIDPGGKRGPDVTVVIPKGSSTSQIADRLARAGVVHNSTLFALYVRIQGAGPLLPGTYNLPKNSPYSAAISALEKGPKILTDSLTIPPGFTLAQVAQRVGALPGLGLSAQKFVAAADNGSVRSAFEPAAVNDLEGFLYPDTYTIQQGESEVDVLEKLVGNFDSHAEQIGLDNAATKLGVTPYKVIEVASIIEHEAKLPGDRAGVASAIYNRLKIGMTLGADSTQTYYLRLSDPGLQPSVAQLNQPSPYNTRVNKGLPPTPIGNPGLASLEAAAQPATTTYLYFVEINPDGQLGFASDGTGFEHLQQECRAAKLC
jgi:UPF0755 protein